MKKLLSSIIAVIMAVSLVPAIPAIQKTDAIASTHETIVSSVKGASCKVVKENVKLDASIDKSKYKSTTEAGVDARKQVYNHKSTVKVFVKSKSGVAQDVFDNVESVVYAETSNPNQGDFMRWEVDEVTPTCTAKKSGKYYYYTIKVKIVYLTTLSQRNTLDANVSSVLRSFKFTNKTSEYKKAKAIYDYVCKNVKYAKSTKSSIVYSAYSAMIKKKAVCQGYATLMYKMLRTAGISARLIAGDATFSGDNHGWNIAKIGKYYYNLDSTWDATLHSDGKNYEYFLCGDPFVRHTRWDAYNNRIFYNKYPMAAKKYGSKKQKASTATKIAQLQMKVPKFAKLTRKKAVFKKVSNAKKYEIKYSGESKFKKKYTVKAYTKKTTFKFKKVKKLKKGVHYFVKYRVYKKINKVTYKTKWSKKKFI